MASKGYVGFTATLMQDKQDVPFIMCWSPAPAPEYIGRYGFLCDQMLEEMTEEDEYVNWYDCRKEERDV